MEGNGRKNCPVWLNECGSLYDNAFVVAKFSNAFPSSLTTPVLPSIATVAMICSLTAPRPFAARVFVVADLLHARPGVGALCDTSLGAPSAPSGWQRDHSPAQLPLSCPGWHGLPL